jgi:hypothetical protein
MTPVQMMVAMRKDLEFAMPARGITKTIARHSGYVWERVHWRCEAEGCWYIATPSSEANLKSIQATHLKPGADQCPTLPRRERLPSGKMEIEKLWSELDDVVDCLQNKTSYRGMSPEEMKGYAKGLAWTVVMKETDFFQDIRSVTVEAVKRWKRRKGDLPWEATPSKETHAHKWFPNGGWVQVKRDDMAGLPGAKKPVVKPAKTWQPGQVKAIRAAGQSGMFSHEDLASTYDTTVAEIKKLLAG